jgi:acyl-CoA thioesterase-1
MSYLPSPLRFVFGAVLLCLTIQSSHAELLVKSGDSIAFLGDSITKQGSVPTGWCGLVISSLKATGIDATPINAGRGGHTTRDMLGRFEADVIARQPSWMILMCGTNDNPNRGLPPEESQKNITTIVEKTQAAGIKVLIATRPMRGGDTQENAYNEFLRKLAKDKNLPLAEVFGAMASAQAEHLKQNPSLPKNTPYLTIADGTHMNPHGNQVIAESILTALGLTPDQIATAKKSWPDPDKIEGLSVEEAKKDVMPTGK